MRNAASGRAEASGKGDQFKIVVKRLSLTRVEDD
jgi:hypothetical protein